MNHPQYGPALKLFVNKIDYLAKLYDEKVLSVKDEEKNISMLIEYDKKTVTEFLLQNIEDEKTRALVENFLEHT